MALSLVRRGFRLSVSSPFLFRPSHSLITLSCSPMSTTIATSYSRPCSFRHLLGGTETFFLSFPSLNHSARLFSSKVSADENLSKVLDSEIKQAKDEAGTHDQYPLPSEFSFSIEDNAGDQSITLERDYFGEKIRATVFLNLESDEGMDDDHDNSQSGDEEDGNSLQASISLVATIDKGDDSFLEFCCTLNPEEFQIDNLAIKKRDAADGQELYEGPPFSDLDEKLQCEFYKYLEERGIKSSLFGFLQDYMIKKDDREYTTWLTNMKEFIEA